MNNRSTSVLLGFTAFLLHYTSLPGQDHPYANSVLLSLLVGAGTFLTYRRGKHIARLAPLHQSVNRTGTHFLAPAFAIVSAAPLLRSASLLHLMPQFALAALITVTYYRPFIIGARTIKGLRAIPAVKNIALAMAWTLATSALIPGAAEAPALFLFRFLFILALSITIDNRDCASDSAHGVQTLALLIGNRSSTCISSLLLIFAAGISSTSLFPADAPDWSGALITVHTIATAIGVMMLKSTSKPMGYFWLIDFQLFLHALLFMITLICT